MVPRADGHTHLRGAQAAGKNLESVHYARTLFDATELLERIETIQPESLKQFGDDVDILKAYLKKERARAAMIEALEGLTVDQHKAWKLAIGKIRKIVGE